MRSRHWSRPRRAAVVAVVIMVLAVLWRVGVVSAPAQPVVLVVGDSLVVAAAPALSRQAPRGVKVAVVAGIGANGAGTASAGSTRYAQGLLQRPLAGLGRSLVAPSTTDTCPS